MSNSNPVDAEDPPEEGGFLSKIGSAWDSFAYGGGVSKQDSDPPSGTTPQAAPQPAVVTPGVAQAASPSPTDASVDPDIVQKAVAFMHTEIGSANHAFKAFMKSYVALDGVISDIGLRVKAAAKLLANEGSSAIDLKVGLAELRQKLNQILQRAKDERDRAKQSVEQKRNAASQSFAGEEAVLNARIEELAVQLKKAQEDLAGLPVRRQQALSQFNPELQQLEVRHVSMETAHQRVLNELGTIERNLE